MSDSPCRFIGPAAPAPAGAAGRCHRCILGDPRENQLEVLGQKLE